jgi:hypothetical protein
LDRRAARGLQRAAGAELECTVARIKVLAVLADDKEAVALDREVERIASGLEATLGEILLGRLLGSTQA